MSVQSVRHLAFAPIFGAEVRRGRGISSQADVLVNSTADGIDLNVIWDEWAAMLDVWNEERTSIASLLSFNTTLRGEAVPQTLAQIRFEEASEFGVPASGRADAEVLLLGHTFKDHDLRLETTWSFCVTPIQGSSTLASPRQSRRTIAADRGRC